VLALLAGVAANHHPIVTSKLPELAGKEPLDRATSDAANAR
jgi:hypothetical protein